MSLNKFYGNEATLKFLKNSLETNTLSHSLLVTGDAGLGKKIFAQFLAKAINCEEGQFFDDCTCVSCHKISEGNHPDVKWYGLDEEESRVKIADIKDLIRWISLKPFEAKSKIFIINQSDKMTLESQNALLKTLEEPPEFSQLILLSSQKNKLLETILSRSIEIKLKPLPSDIIQKILVEQMGADEDLDALVQLSQGNLGKALEYADNSVLEHSRGVVAEWIELGSWQFLEQYGTKTREQLRETIDLMVSFLRDLLISKVQGSSESLVYREEVEKLAYLDKTKTPEDIRMLIEELLNIRESLENNLNQKIAAQHCATKLQDQLF